MSGKINHRHVTAYTDDPTADVSADEWNDSLVLSEGINGQFMVREIGSPDGWSWHTFSVSDLPPSASLPVASIVATDYIAVGSNPASTGVLRIPYASYLMSRNATNTGDRFVIGLDTQDAPNRISIGDSGSNTIVSGAGDASGILGSATRRWAQLFLSDFVAIGTNPATTGAVRLQNLAAIKARDGSNLNDGSLIKLDAAAYVVLADQTVTNGVLIDNPWLRFVGITAAFPALLRSGSGLQCILADGSAYAPFTCGSVNAYSPGAFVSIGTNPAQAGSLRLSHAGAIRFRSNDNAGDLYFVSFGVEGASEIVYLGSSGVLAVAPGAGQQLGTAATPWGTLYTSGNITLTSATGTATIGTASAALGTIYVNQVRSGTGQHLDLIPTGATSIIRFFPGGSNLISMNAAGTFYPVTDNTGQLGGGSNRFVAAYFSQTVVIGTNPALTGAIRLANATGMYARNAANTADLLMAYLDASNTLIVTDTGVPLRVYGGTMILGSAALSGAPAFRASGTEAQAIIADASDYATFRAKTFIANGGSFQATTNTGFVSIGSPAATQGAIRLWKDGYIYVRDQSNAADIVILGAFPPGVFITSSGAPVLYPGSGDASGDLGDATHRWGRGYFSTLLSVGTNPAQTGAIRMANQDGIFARNAANTADIRLLRLNSSDSITLGSGSAPLTLAGSSLIIGASYFDGVELPAAPAAPAADGWRLYAEDNGSGKTRLMARFATGAPVQIAIEP